MFIASQLKKENIAEYILYMWQVEDLIRALGLDLDRIDAQIIAPYPTDEAGKRQMRDWYESLIDMMRRENVQQQGHLQLIANTVNDLEEMHLYLLRQGKDAAYAAKFYYILPSLTALKAKSNHPATMGDMEMCLIFLYGIMQLRRQGKELSDDTQRMLDEVRKLMILASKNYEKWRNDNLSDDL